MKRLKINNIDNYDYTLEDSDDKKYILNIEFYGLDDMPKVNDYIYIDEKVLNEKNLFSFGIINDSISNIKEEDIIKVVSNNKEYYLQRYYG